MFKHLSRKKQWMSRNNGMIPLHCWEKNDCGLKFYSQKKKEKNLHNGNKCPKDKGNCLSLDNNNELQHTLQETIQRKDGWQVLIALSHWIKTHLTQHMAVLEDHPTPGLGVLDCGVEKVLLSSLSGLNRRLS